METNHMNHWSTSHCRRMYNGGRGTHCAGRRVIGNLKEGIRRGEGGRGGSCSSLTCQILSFLFSLLHSLAHLGRTLAIYASYPSRDSYRGLLQASWAPCHCMQCVPPQCPHMLRHGKGEDWAVSFSASLTTWEEHTAAKWLCICCIAGHSALCSCPFLQHAHLRTLWDLFGDVSALTVATSSGLFGA